MSITNVEVVQETTNVEVTQVPATNLTVTQQPTINIDISLPGPQGAAGPQGLTGNPGPSNSLTLGTVNTGVEGSSASVLIEGASPSQTISFVIPRGNTGAQGPIGITGPQGEQGLVGPQGIQGIQGIQGPVGPAGLTWRNTWDAGTDYVKDDAVYYNFSSWFASVDPPLGDVPSDSSLYWYPLAARGAQGIQGEQGIQGIQGPQGPAGTGTVNSVNGYTTADIILTKADIGLSNADNTSDLAKPISNATQTALNLKAPLASPTFTGVISGDGSGITNLNAINLTGTIVDARLPARIGVSTQTITDWNTALDNGWYKGYQGVATNSPDFNKYYYGQVIQFNSVWVQQTVYEFENSYAGTTTPKAVYRRELNNTTWTAWQRVNRTEAELDIRYVTTSGNQTISGIKTFSGQPALNSGLFVNGSASNNFIYFGNSGTQTPTFTTRSAGVKIVLRDSLTSASVDYGLGIDASTLWTSVPTSAESFKWYGGTTLAATLTGTGNLVTTGTIQSSGAMYAMARLRAGFTANTTATPLTTSSAEFELSSQSMVTIGESAAGNANPHITMYRTDAGVRSGRGFRQFLPSTGGPFKMQWGGANVAYGSETYTDALTLDTSGNMTVVGSVTSAGTIHAHGVSSNIRVKADGTGPKDGGIYADPTGNIWFANWDATRGFKINSDGSVNTLGVGRMTLGGSLTVSGGDITLNNATVNTISLGANGVAPPAFTTRSVGSKVVLYSSVSGTQVDYALGIEASTLWYSIPQSVANQYFKWYGGTTVAMTLTGTGNLSTLGSITSTGAGYFGNGGIFGPETDSTAFVRISTNQVGNKGLVIRGVASQTADLQQWQNSAGSAVAKIDANGAINSGKHIASHNGTDTLYVDRPLEVNSTQRPGIAFHKPSVVASQLVITDAGMFEFRNIDLTSLVAISAAQINSSTGVFDSGNRVYSASNPPTEFVKRTLGGSEATATIGTTGTLTMDLATANIFSTGTTTGAITLATSNVPATGNGVTITVIINQGATAYAITMPAGTIWLGAAPTQVANKKCVINMMTVDGGTTWIASGSVQA